MGLTFRLRGMNTSLMMLWSPKTIELNLRLRASLMLWGLKNIEFNLRLLGLKRSLRLLGLKEIKLALSLRACLGLKAIGFSSRLTQSLKARRLLGPVWALETSHLLVQYSQRSPQLWVPESQGQSTGETSALSAPTQQGRQLHPGPFRPGPLTPRPPPPVGLLPPNQSPRSTAGGDTNSHPPRTSRCPAAPQTARLPPPGPLSRVEGERWCPSGRPEPRLPRSQTDLGERRLKSTRNRGRNHPRHLNSWGRLPPGASLPVPSPRRLGNLARPCSRPC